MKTTCRDNRGRDGPNHFSAAICNYTRIHADECICPRHYSHKTRSVAATVWDAHHAVRKDARAGRFIDVEGAVRQLLRDIINLSNRFW